MEDFYINNTSTNTSYNYSSIDTNASLDYYTHSDSYDDVILINVMEWIIICAGLPLTLVAIAAVYSLVKNNHIAPVYIINLLISDLIQLCCMTAWKFVLNDIIYFTYLFGVLASVGFVVCVSVFNCRYLVITQPLWYRFRRNIKTSLIVCVVVWILPLVYVLPLYFDVNFYVTETIFAVFVLLPLPLFIFFLVGTLKALSTARSVPADEKRRIVAILIVVLLIYTLLFLPSVIWSLVEKARDNRIFHNMAFFFLNLSPLADLTMYVFIRKGAIDKLLASMPRYCVKATCVPHNYLRRTAPHDLALMTALPTEADRDAAGLQPVSRVGSNNATREAIRVRETFMAYFTKEGAVTWQP
ncbi:G-protein coupled receptor 4-like [Odontesthes bonariensis]|uniref:G-protein coupled receptor 4-like n=1 Tax=Odontesthes bonariensis TaxID=219752 RepID=UPI003F58F93F